MLADFYTTCVLSDEYKTTLTKTRVLKRKIRHLHGGVRRDVSGIQPAFLTYHAVVRILP